MPDTTTPTSPQTSESYFLSPQERAETRWRRIAGYGMISLAVLGAALLGLFPHLFGSRDAPVGLGLAVALVAGYRIVRLLTAVKEHDARQRRGPAPDLPARGRRARRAERLRGAGGDEPES